VSPRQYASHLEAQGKPAPKPASVAGHPWPHLQPLGTGTRSPAEGLTPASAAADPSEVADVALRGAGELLRVTKARQAADERLAVTLTLGELRELVRDAAIEAVAESGGAPQPALLDRSGLAQALGVGTSTVDRFRREGCPVLWVGDSPRFELEPCMAWLRGRSSP
jgi:hypothetical protein